MRQSYLLLGLLVWTGCRRLLRMMLKLTIWLSKLEISRCLSWEGTAITACTASAWRLRRLTRWRLRCRRSIIFICSGGRWWLSGKDWLAWFNFHCLGYTSSSPRPRNCLVLTIRKNFLWRKRPLMARSRISLMWFWNYYKTPSCDASIKRYDGMLIYLSFAMIS